jgi:hypothetical protein
MTTTRRSTTTPTTTALCLSLSSSSSNNNFDYCLLFDCDGVILETEELHRVAYNAAFRKFGLTIDNVPVEWSVGFVGRGGVAYHSTQSLFLTLFESYWFQPTKIETDGLLRYFAKHGGWWQA